MSSGPKEILPVPLSDVPSGGFASDPGYAEMPGDEEGGIDVKRYLAAAYRHKWLILGLGVLGFGAGIGLSKMVRPEYSAQAAIQIENSSRGAAQQSPIRNTPLLESRAWLELLKSYLVLDEVVRRRQLYIGLPSSQDRPLFVGFALADQFTPGNYVLRVDGGAKTLRLLTEAGTALEDAAIGDSIGRSIGFLWAPAIPAVSRDIPFSVRPPRDAAVRLAGDLQAQLPENGAVIRLSLQGQDPAGIAETVNAVGERFVEVAASLKRENLTTRTELLREQVASAYRDLTNAETALERFKINTITLPNDRGVTPIASGLQETRDPVRRAFFNLRIERDSVAQERDAILRALSQGVDTSTTMLIALNAIPSVRSAIELSTALADLGAKRAEARQLRLAFTSSHPTLAKLEPEIQELQSRTIPDQARALASALDQRVKDYDARIAASSLDLQQIPARSTEEARLERNVAMATTLHTSLQEAYQQAQLAELSSAPDVRILDRAVPPTQPVRERILMIIAGGLAGGFGLGVLLALMLDRLDRRIRYPDQVSKELGLAILGALPMVEHGAAGKPKAEQAGYLLEALRTVRLNLNYAHGTAGTLITTITSPGTGDGKSFVSVNLAKSFAEAGRRTLLIDADTRRGLQHRTMGVDRKPGLLDYLSGSNSREEIIRAVPAWGIDFIPCGTRMSGGPELLSSHAMAQLVLSLRAEYQVIIVDSPPIGAGIDPLVLASLTGSLVMVLRTGVTDRELAETRLHELNRLPIRVLGAILNDVKPEGVYKYYSYLPGYRAEDEPGEVAGSPKRRILGLR